MDELRQDEALLRDFARRGDQAAFAGIVRRHVDLVYGTALRKTGEAVAAEEIAQDVFAALAKNAWQFGPGDSAPAWLHRATLLKARQWWRGEFRRRHREQIAAELGTTMKTPQDQSTVQDLLPLLDEALLSLRERDRAALLLRYHERQSLRAVGRSLGIGEDAAQKRVASALRKVAVFFQRHGFKTTTAAASAIALEQSATSAPVALANALVKAAHLAAPATGGLTAALSRLASLSKAQCASLCTAILVLPTAFQWNKLQSARHDLSQTQGQYDATLKDLSNARANEERLQVTATDMSNGVAAAEPVRAQNDAALGKLAELTERLHAMLASEHYRWPDDLPFVRVPRAQNGFYFSPKDQPFDASGRLSEFTVETLGLTPEEKTFTEEHLSRYLQQVFALAAKRLYETNEPNFAPRDGSVAKAWVIPPLGPDGERLWSSEIYPIRHALGEDRYNQFTVFYMQCFLSAGTYPWSYEDNAGKIPAKAEIILSVKVDATNSPSYNLIWCGHAVLDGKFPMHMLLPEFLRERFDPWLNSLGIYDIYADQP